MSEHAVHMHTEHSTTNMYHVWVRNTRRTEHTREEKYIYISQWKSCAKAKPKLYISSSISLSSQCRQVESVNYFYLFSSTYIHLSFLSFVFYFSLQIFSYMYVCVYVRACDGWNRITPIEWFNVTAMWICLRISFVSRKEKSGVLDFTSFSLWHLFALKCYCRKVNRCAGRVYMYKA